MTKEDLNQMCREYQQVLVMSEAEVFEEPTNINGYIELGGTIHKVTSKEDIKKLAEKL